MASIVGGRDGQASIILALYGGEGVHRIPSIVLALYGGGGVHHIPFAQ